MTWLRLARHRCSQLLPCSRGNLSLPAHRSAGKRRFAPRVEVLEDRSLLDAKITGPGQITTTAGVNHVAIIDDGQKITVFSNGLVGSFDEGTPLTIRTNKKGSVNLITYVLPGSDDPNGPNAITINASLTVNFGTGNGELDTSVVDPKTGTVTPTGSNLGHGSQVQITANSTRGNIVDTFACGSIGNGATFSDVDNGGKGNDSFGGSLFGEEFSAATATLKLTGGDGNNSASIDDGQDIDSGASTTIDLRCKGDSDDVNNLSAHYEATVQGSLNVTVDAGPGNGNTIDLRCFLAAGSNGVLTSAAQTGPGAAKVTDTVHKKLSSATVNETATGIGKGSKTLTFTNGSTPQSVAVIESGFTVLIPVP
jgi:hypothetical protein